MTRDLTHTEPPRMQKRGRLAPHEAGSRKGNAMATHLRPPELSKRPRLPCGDAADDQGLQRPAPELQRSGPLQSGRRRSAADVVDRHVLHAVEEGHGDTLGKGAAEGRQGLRRPGLVEVGEVDATFGGGAGCLWEDSWASRRCGIAGLKSGAGVARNVGRAWVLEARMFAKMRASGSTSAGKADFWARPRAHNSVSSPSFRAGSAFVRIRALWARFWEEPVIPKNRQGEDDCWSFGSKLRRPSTLRDFEASVGDAKFAHKSATVGRSPSKCGSHMANARADFVQSRPQVDASFLSAVRCAGVRHPRVGTSSTKIHALASLGPMLADGWPNLAKVWPKSDNVDPSLAKVGKTSWPTLGQL